MRVITSRGLKPLNNTLEIKAGMQVYMGYSNYPDICIVEKIENDMVYYYKRNKQLRERLSIFKDLAFKGCNTMLIKHKEYLNKINPNNEYLKSEYDFFKKSVEDLENILNNTGFTFYNYKDYEVYNFKATKRDKTSEVTCPRSGNQTRDYYYLMECYFNQVGFSDDFTEYSCNGKLKDINNFKEKFSKDFIISDLVLDTFEY